MMDAVVVFSGAAGAGLVAPCVFLSCAYLLPVLSLGCASRGMSSPVSASSVAVGEPAEVFLAALASAPQPGCPCLKASMQGCGANWAMKSGYFSSD